jgi:hypothetical protein
MREPAYLSDVGVPTLSKTGVISYPAGLSFESDHEVGINPNSVTSMSNYWRDNAAAYGDNYATDIYAINATTVITVLRYDKMFPAIKVAGYDYYGQMVVTENSAVVSLALDKYTAASNCYPYIGSLVGKSERTFLNGMVVFTDLIGYCRPGAHNDLVFSVLGLLNSSVTQVTFQSCLKGEKATGQSCTCLVHASQCSGSDVFVSRGYWRISPLSNTISTCPFGAAACAGGNGTGDALCIEGYMGPLCAVCTSGYMMNTFSRACDKCHVGRPSPIAVVLIVLVAIFSLLFTWRFFNISGEMVLLNLADYLKINSSYSGPSCVWWRPSQWLWRIRTGVMNVINRLTFVSN